jgi:superfamily II DNA or RNA helicase
LFLKNVIVQRNLPKKLKLLKNKKLLKTSKVEPIFWVLQNNKRFPAWINQTFLKYKLTEETKMKSVNGKFTPFKYQLFLRDYMQNASPYRGIVLMHGLGSGKTCSAITIAENLKSDKNIIVISPASLRGNFIGNEKEGLMFCGDPRYQKNPELIHEKYTFISSNASNTLAQMKAVDFDNHVVIIDEAHNLVSRMVGGLDGDNKQGRGIYEKLMNAKNCKIIALTGTPVVNDIYEAAVLMNVLRGYMYITVYDIVHVSPKYGKNWNLRQLEEKLEAEEYVDYLEINKANRTILFNLRIQPWDTDYEKVLIKIAEIAKELEINIQYNTYQKYTLFPDESDGKGKEEFDKYFINESKDGMKNVELYQRRTLGLVSYYKGKQGNLPEVKVDEFVDVDMSSYQFAEYMKVRELEKSSRQLSEIRVFSRQYSNFVFPPEIRRPGITEKITKKDNKGNEDLAKVMKANENMEDKDEVKKAELKKYQRAVDLALKELSDNADQYLVQDKLGRYSNKMKAMLDNIDNSKGLVFVYSDFRTLEGVGVFAEILKANGYTPYKSKGNNRSNKNQGKKGSYALYTGSEDMEERERIKKVFTSADNKYGKHLKIILATSAGAEGLNLKNIRQVHIMEPYWNNIRIKQVVGRAVRRDSHIDLPKEERNVSVFKYMSLISPDDQRGLPEKERISTDQVVLNIARKKEMLTDDMLEVMKATAVDCVLNALDNEGNIKCFSFGENVDGIAYVPMLGRDLGRGVEAEMKVVEKQLRHGGISVDNMVYFIENKKLYKATDKLRRNPVTKVPKMKKKVAVDIDNMEVYDHDSAIRKKMRVKIGNINEKSEFKRN